MKLLKTELRNMASEPITPSKNYPNPPMVDGEFVEKKPNWLKMKLPSGERVTNLRSMMKELNLATVCQEAKCPNLGECWSGGTATVMIMGDTCTRGCRFCNVKTANPRNQLPLDKDEPYKVGFATAQMDIDYVVVTSVDRDDLEDYGASHFAKTVRVMKENNPKLLVEVLTPDFNGDETHIRTMVEGGPDVFAQNVETVERLTRYVRDPRAGYWKTLNVLKKVKEINPNMYTKTSLMLGLGETDEEVLACMQDLRSVACDVITFGQYLQPTQKHLKVVEYVRPEKFDYWRDKALEMGFLYCASGPMVRSSYRAGEFFMTGMIERQRRGEGDGPSPLPANV
ncbi:MAG: lipoyl synthase [Bdellovibrionota bacterium]